MAARLLDAAFAVVYLRLLGRTDVGAYQFLVVFTTYLDTLVDFGLNALVAREVSRGAVAAASAFRAVNSLRLGLWLVGLPVVAVVYGPLRLATNLPDDAVLAGWVFYLALLPSVAHQRGHGHRALAPGVPKRYRIRKRREPTRRLAARIVAVVRQSAPARPVLQN